MERTAFFDDDDEDDEFEFDDDDEVAQSLGRAQASKTAQTVVSPFEGTEGSVTGVSQLDFNKENVDKVLEEVRPYLISDGGNVSVERVDKETQNVYLLLEGACGK